MNMLFMGGKEIGNYCLKKLIEDNQIPKIIITMKDIIEKEIFEIAKEKDIEVIELDSYKKNINLIKSMIDKYNIDILVSVAFPFVLSGEIINIIKHPINVHPAALPKYRGFHPLSEAFLRDDAYQGTTVHYMSEIVDEGDIILQDFVAVTNTDDMVSIKEKLIKLSSDLLIMALRQIRDNCVFRRVQIGERIYAPKRTPNDSLINFNNNSRYLHNFIRALVDPYPNAFIIKGDQIINIKKSVTSNDGGIVLDKTLNGRYVVSTKDGVILIETDSELEIGERL